MTFDFETFKNKLERGFDVGFSKKNRDSESVKKLMAFYERQLNYWQSEIEKYQEGTPEHTNARRKIKKYKAFLHIK